MNRREFCGTPFHLDVVAGRYFFAKVPDREVAEELIVRAESVRAFVCSDLQLTPPGIVWIRPVPPNSKHEPPKYDHEEELDAVVRLPRDTAGGLTPKNRRLNEIWIRSDLTTCPHLECVVAHELRHATQKKHRPDVFGDECRAEGDAYPYGYEVMKRYFASSGRLTDELRQELDMQEIKTRKWFQSEYPDGEYKTVNCSEVT